jgi:hypothetical protein
MLLKTGLVMRALAPAFVMMVTVPSIMAQDTQWAKGMFSAQSHDFKIVARGADVAQRITIENKFTQDVHIASVTTSCGCTIGKIIDNKNTLKSRETCELEISIDTVRHMGEKNTQVTVTFDAPYYTSVIIPIHVYIRRDIVIQPGGAKFNSVEQGKEATQTLKVEYAGRADWTVRGVESTDPNITASINQLSRIGTEVKYDLKVNVKPSMPVGEFRSSVYLLTDDANSPKVPVLVEGRVDPDVYVTNPVVSLGMLAPGEKKTVSVIVRSKRPMVIEKIESASNNELFMTKLSSEEKTMHVVPLTVTAPSEAGTLQEEFSLKISGRTDPVYFKAYGQITAK